MDGFEICFAAELDVGGKGNRRLKYLFSTSMWVLVPFKRGITQMEVGESLGKK